MSSQIVGCWGGDSVEVRSFANERVHTVNPLPPRFQNYFLGHYPVITNVKSTSRDAAGDSLEHQ